MRYHGHATVDPTSPVATAICDRCSFYYLHKDLRWQMEYAGNNLINKRLLVCPTCMDTPQDQLRARYLPPDPVPISDPRPDPMAGEQILPGQMFADDAMTQTAYANDAMTQIAVTED